LGGNEVGGKGGERPGFAAARHGGDSKFAAAVAEDAFLGGARGKFSHRKYLTTDFTDFLLVRVMGEIGV
jgi:hypothetical protein